MLTLSNNLFAQTGQDSSLYIDKGGNTNLGGNLLVKGNAQLDGGLTAKGNAQLDGNLTLKGNQITFGNNNAPLSFTAQNDGFVLSHTRTKAKILFTTNGIYTAGVDNQLDQDLNIGVSGKGNLHFKTNGNYGMVINSAGNVSISTQGRVPVNKLEIDGNLHMDGNAIYLGKGTSNTKDYIKWVGPTSPRKLNNDRIRISGAGGVELGSTDGNNTGLSVAQNGFIGIGTDDPKFPLHVTAMQGSYPFNYSHGATSVEVAWSKRYVNTTDNRKFSTCGILSDGDIVTHNALVSTASKVYSDIRLKKDIKLSLSKQDLEKLNEIQIVNYKMIDTIADNRSYKKVIAQQIQKVYPRATDIGFRTLPDVFQLATSVIPQKDSTYLITLTKLHNLKVGDRVELKCEPARDVAVEVTRILSANKFVVRSTTALNEQRSVFVYGHPAADVLTVDYDALSMLNISATQELSKTIDAQQKRIQELTLENERLKSEQAATKSTVNTILARLSQIENSNNQPAQVVAAVNNKH